MLRFAIFLATPWFAFPITFAEAISPLSLAKEENPSTLWEKNSLSAQLYATLSSFRGIEPENQRVAQGFQDHLSSVSGTLDTLSVVANDTQLSQRAAIACKISSLLFPHAVITEGPQYTQEKNAQW